MSKKLELSVLMRAVDRVTGPIKAIRGGVNQSAHALKENRERLRELQSQQSDISSFYKTKAAARETKTEYERSESKVRELARAMAGVAAPSRAMTAEFNRARKEAAALKRTHEQQQQQLHGLRSRLSAAGISTRKLGDQERDLQRRIDETSRSIDTQTEALKRAARQQELLSNAKEKYERSKASAGALAGTGAAAMAAGGGVLYAGARMIAPAVEAQRQGSLIAAQTGGDGAKAEQYTATIRAIHADGLSTDVAAIGAAVSAVQSTFGAMGDVAAAELDRISRRSIDIAEVFGVDVATAAQTAGQMVKNKLAADSGAATDLLAAGMQRVSTQMRGELPEILNEYGTNFRNFGYEGGEMMTVFVGMADQGKHALDKAGDAIKEFGIRGSDMSKASQEAYARIGLDAEEMADAIATGGKGAKQALQMTARGLLAIESPSERANAAIALFGTPLEDLSIDQIPAFLGVLANTENKFAHVGGTAEKLGAALRDNLAGDLQKMSGAWSELGASMADTQSGPLRGMVQWVSQALAGVRAWARANPALSGGLVTVAAAVAGVAAVGGALALTVAGLIGPFAMAKLAMLTFGVKSLPLLGLLPKIGLAIKAVGGALWALAANPVVLVIAGIAAAIAGAAYLIWSNWGTLAPKFGQAWESIKAGFAATEAWFSALPQRFAQFGADILKGLVVGVTSQLGAVREAIMGAGEAVTGWFKEKLGIHSPSRVFAELGGWTMAGLDQGLAAAQDGPLKTVAQTAKQLATAGTVAIGAGMAMPALADTPNAPAFDARPPLSAAAPSAAGGAGTVTNHFQIHITAGPGMDEQAIAMLVRREIERTTREQSARQRSRLYDGE